MAPAADVMAAGEIGELVARRRGDDHLPGMRVVERRPGPLEAVGIPEQSLVPGRRPTGRARRKRELLSLAADDGLAVLEEERRLDRRLLVEPLGQCTHIVLVAQPVEHPGAVRCRHQHSGKIAEGLLQANVPVDLRLAVVGAKDNRVPLEKLVGAAGCVEQRPDRRVAAHERFERRVGAVDVGGEVVVGQVIDQEVEAVAGDEPPPHRRRVRVDRPLRPSEHRERSAGRIRLEEVVEEEPLRPVGGDRHGRQRRQVRRRSAIAGDVDRGRGQSRFLERLVYRHGVRTEMQPVEVDDRVDDRPRHAGGANGAERRAVFDETLALAVVPDEMRDVVNVGMRTGRDRRQAHRRQ